VSEKDGVRAVVQKLICRVSGRFMPSRRPRTLTRVLGSHRLIAICLMLENDNTELILTNPNRSASDPRGTHKKGM